jgi:hypothetical protein
VSADHITVQVFKNEDPTDLIRAHLNNVTEEVVTINEFTGLKLVGQGESEEAPMVTHTILTTETGWFVFSTEKDDQNYSETMKTLKLK